MEYPRIINGKLVLVSSGGSVTSLGINGFRRLITQIKSSPRQIKKSTRKRLHALEKGVAMWDRQQ